MKNNIKYFARFIVETAGPIAIGSGEKGLEVDRLIIRDANGLPYIPGTSLAGVVRSEMENLDDFDKTSIDELFGFQKNKDGQGSRISFSPAKLIGADGTTVIEGLQNLDFSEGYYSFFQKLPQRDHVRINSRGTADVSGHGKFDEELVFKGTRFAFEIELSGTQDDETAWHSLLNILYQPFFRIGAGTRKGFGKLEIIKCKTQAFHLPKDLDAYLDKTNSLNFDCSHWEDFDAAPAKDKKWLTYKLDLQPENYFLFGAGFGDEEVDMQPKTERFFDWSSGTPQLGEEQEHILIPATSIKGALSHRLAYHFNRLKKRSISRPYEKEKDFCPSLDTQKAMNKFLLPFAINGIDLDSESPKWKDLETQIQQMSFEDFKNNSTVWQQFIQAADEVEKAAERNTLPVGENNEAVKALFGFALGDEEGARGKIILSDVYKSKEETAEKVFSHVAIDRFTAGGIDGALYQERVVKSSAFQFDIFVHQSAFEGEDGDIMKAAFHQTLDDLLNGQLQLGGNTAKGHGAFKGTLNIDTKDE